ncbi:alpha-1,2-mannosyltransferase ktr1 [Spiromyces aspiralis]|uniref:Alpha-1,2-mannosyltransferase ktr1 n=1 Tax=Spiromyces aspiralis TaxID=68401 RepID=A0ACC1HRW0_9FUNG|nr:alpha-1,2-mannosyltransferase ktr1 [Spiromyces aspiralis]
MPRRLSWKRVILIAVTVLFLHVFIYIPWKNYQATIHVGSHSGSSSHPDEPVGRGESASQQLYAIMTESAAKDELAHQAHAEGEGERPAPEQHSEDQEQAEAQPRLDNAAFVILARNKDLDDLRTTLIQLELAFNSRYHYPYVFLNDMPFTDQFIEGVQEVISGKAEFGLIPKEHWSYPDWIDQDKARQRREEMQRQNVFYAMSESYRHMCRFNSGFFYLHPLLDPYEWYWRVEPSVQFPCHIDYDPFRYLRDHNKLYSFTISIQEYPNTIPSLWNTSLSFIKERPDLIPKENMWQFVETTNPTTGLPEYNNCHFWSNFEIANLNFWRSGEYRAYFEYLDRAGGFFYERWGDAPVHSLAIAMFLRSDQVHWFEDMGYFHNPLWNCPQDAEVHKRLGCYCDPKQSVQVKHAWWSCTQKFNALAGQ